MANSRCVVILSLPRSGSSAVAGALLRMGVDLGEGFLQPADRANPRGYYEDMRWSAINKTMAGTRYGVREPAGLSQRHRQNYAHLVRICSRKPVWGIKSPRLCFVLHLILPMLESASDVRLVRVRRDWKANVASFKRHSEVAYNGRFKMTDDEAEALLSEWEAALERRLEGFSGPVFEVDYDDLVGDPVSVLTELETFCFKGIKRLSAGIKGAVTWIDPLLRHEYEDTTADAEPEVSSGNIAEGDEDGHEDTDSDTEPEASGGDSAEGSGNGGSPKRRD